METVGVIVDTPDDFGPERLEGEILSLEEERDRREEAKRPPWRVLSTYAGEIEEHKDDPWIKVMLADEELCRLRVGGMVVLMGGPGSGKSSLAANVLIQHAKDVGPAIAMSIELPGVELAGRIVGIKCDASWEEALTGKVPPKFVADALALDRFFVIDRKRATLANLVACATHVKAAFPGQPILCAIDYAQLMPSKEREIRQRVSDVFEQIDDVTREHLMVTLALSQMGRSGAEAARTGEKLGAETAALGAESAAIERFASTTLTIGMKGEPREDGSQEVDLSVGKTRMGIGDRVVPMEYQGRSGRWRVAGEAKSSKQVRDARDEKAAAAESQALENQLIGALTASEAPLTRNDLCDKVVGKGSGGKKRKLAAIGALVKNKTFVEVGRRAPKAPRGSWMIWTPSRAREAGVLTIEEFRAANGEDP